MKKFVALYLAPAAAIAQMREHVQKAPESAKAGMDAWMQWAKQHEKSRAWRSARQDQADQGGRRRGHQERHHRLFDRSGRHP